MSHNLEYIKKQYISMFKRVEGNPSDLSSRLDNVEKRLNSMYEIEDDDFYEFEPKSLDVSSTFNFTCKFVEYKSEFIPD
jgi:hypothetical protein